MHKYGLKQLTDEERRWLALQSRLLGDGVAADVNTGVLERMRAGKMAWTIVFTLVIGAGAFALIGWSLLQLNRFAHSMGPVMLMVLGAAVAAGLIALCWRGAVTLAHARLPFAPMWIVTTEHLIHASGTGVTVWPIRDVTQVNVRRSKAGVSVDCTREDGRRVYVHFGAAIYGGLTWPEGGSIARAIQMVGSLPTAESVSGLFESSPQTRSAPGPGAFRWRALAAGMVALVCIGGSFAYSRARVAEVRSLMASGALSSAYGENGDVVDTADKVVSGARSDKPTSPSAESGARPGETTGPAPGEVKATPPVPKRAKINRPGKANGKRVRRTRSSPRPGAPRTTGGLSRQVISRVVSRKRGAIGACYRQGLASNPGLQGRVLVKLVIGSSGAVTSARDAGSSLPDRRVVNCVVGHMRALTFPAPQGGSATILYPVDLRP